jgi:molybdopterin-guanine dinucleotide biosynthesis protein A
MRGEIEGFILAGGASTRMGREKALLEVGGELMVLRLAALLDRLCAQVTLIAPPQSFMELPLRVIPDDQPGLGPLGGITTALRVSRAEWNLVVGCDLPFLTRPWLAFLMARARSSMAHAVMAQGLRGPVEPLCAMYRASARPQIAAALARGVRKVTDGLEDLRLEMIPASEWKAFDSRGLLFKNMNAPEDYEEVRRLLEGEHAHPRRNEPGRCTSSGQ